MGFGPRYDMGMEQSIQLLGPFIYLSSSEVNMPKIGKLCRIGPSLESIIFLSQTGLFWYSMICYLNVCGDHERKQRQSDWELDYSYLSTNVG